MSERIYESYDRNRIPRNKYGVTNFASLIYNSSTFGSNQAAQVVGSQLVTIDDFKGATRTEPGVRGLVPQPQAGQNQYFLQGNGAWTDIPAYRWMKEFPEGEGFVKSGLTIEGDFNVKKNLSTFNLSVEGTAHFWELIIDKVKANGGQIIVSPSLFHVDYVGDIQYIDVFTSDSPLALMLQARKDIHKMMNACHVKQVKCRRLYMRNDDETKRIENECQVGDMIRCRSFNIQPGVYHNVSNKDYWTFVCQVGEGSYREENGTEHTAFFIDIAYSLLLQQPITTTEGNTISSLPLGSKLRADGTVEVPEGYTEITDALGLKQKSLDVMSGNPEDAADELFDPEEFKDITKQVVAIRGFADQINDILGL